MHNRCKPTRKLGNPRLRVPTFRMIRRQSIGGNSAKPICRRPVCRPSAGSGSIAPSPAKRSGKTLSHRWCWPRVRNMSRCASADSRCAMAASDVHAWRSKETASHFPLPSDSGDQYRDPLSHGSVWFPDLAERSRQMYPKSVRCVANRKAALIGVLAA
jgi:hypothetical protein